MDKFDMARNKKSKEEPQYLSVAEFAKAVRYKPRQIRRLIKSGEVVATRGEERRKWQIHQSEVPRFRGEPQLIQEQAAKSEPEAKQESPPIKQARHARLRDERTFRKSDSIINEEGLLSFLVRLELHNTYLGSTLKKLKEFRDLFGLETNKYVDDELTSLSDELVKTLTKLIRFLEFSFKDTGGTETINAYDDNVYIFNPQNRYLRESEQYLEELQQLSWTSRDAYEAYRAAVRKILFL
ncbi:hypothetical protein ACFLW8_06170 [Chloroflexota bacterium]